METTDINEIKNILPYFLKYENVWVNYDKDTDVMYLHFKKPNHADYTEMTDDDIIIRFENDEIIGLTILNASKRK
jgi:uncharacterized protein YuzE